MAIGTKTKQIQEELKMDMTPMIDCVFLLIIFFVLVIDLSQQDMEDLILPKAEYAQPDENPPEVRPIVNINQKGQVVYKRNIWYDPERHGQDFSQLKKLLIWFKQNVARQESIRQEKVGGGMVMTVIDDPILIRADKWTEWHYVGKFMEGCTQKEAAFWKLELAMSEEDKEERVFKNPK